MSSVQLSPRGAQSRCGTGLNVERQEGTPPDWEIKENEDAVNHQQQDDRDDSKNERRAAS